MDRDGRVLLEGRSENGEATWAGMTDWHGSALKGHLRHVVASAVSEHVDDEAARVLLHEGGFLPSDASALEVMRFLSARA